jgi:hypothetical protein
LVLGGLLLLAYSDPAVGVNLGGTPGGSTTFTITGTRTFHGNLTGTFPFNGTSGFPTGGLSGRGITSTDTQIETYVGLGLLSVGLLLEVFTIFLWHGPAKPTTEPTT